jgi:hypothetical protein
VFSELLNEDLELEVKIPIGHPPKNHTFDLASSDKRFVGECKAFTWTISGSPPSAKISTLREAANYLRELPSETIGFIVMGHHRHPVKDETLADYFCRLNSHLLGSVAVLELSNQDSLRLVWGKFPNVRASSAT